MVKQLARAAVVVSMAILMSTVVAGQEGASALGDVGALIVGNWTGEGVYAADYPGIGKKGEKFATTHLCRWTTGRAVIICEGSGKKSTWTTVYWWDAGAKQVKYLGLDSGGNSAQGTVAKQGAKLVWASAGSFADGTKVEYKGETTVQDNGNTYIEAGATILGGVPSEFRDTFRRVVK